MLERADLLTDRVAEVLRSAIADGSLAPGQHLRVPEIARQLGVSRTPAREALLILAREGLVGSRPGAGLQVLVGDHDMLKLTLEMREVLEGLAARRCAEHMAPALRIRLGQVMEAHNAALAAHDLEAHVAHDAEFHRILRDGASSPPLTDELARLERLTMLVNRSLSRRSGFSPKMVDRDHSAIFEAIMAKDGDAAEKAARNHVRRMIRFFDDERAATHDTLA